ncbi:MULTISPECIES: DUF262 domain-containing protein [unclassified Mesorhizobium]|uniref:DUF262 domain-containing protein n=1 Tax=unclassified Mesorhizobium TaxID=325217 RepID=UPI000FDC2DC7|nr:MULTISPECIES: DUF262 domain-containing protein [unclassified Mesorhizobium]TGT65661.1 DUF262 domain-containing protein [Mesorhizobium sp. M2E.F.Ca.ET.166.01.1.1]TGV97706.1 DUF262 domain-containing protein [Mesorhizobium sp. M2E.F.Ca.ET.154.01.1.1]
MQLQPQLFNLNNLLNGRLFRIPEYQRAYAWGKKQRDDLFGDIRRVGNSNEDHFMATIVGLSRERKQIVADQFTVVEIVDGQQRITTLVILLKAIQKALNTDDKTENKLSAELSELLVKGDDLSLLLLQTNHDSSHIFADYIRDGTIPNPVALTSADQNITDAIAESEEFVIQWQSNGETLTKLIGVIRNRLWAIFHSVEDEGLVYRVFEVLNSRGLDVSWIDKFKTQLMGLVFEQGANAGRGEAIKELHLIWQDIYRTIGKQKYLTAETVRFAGTLRAGSAPSRPLSEAISVQRLVELAGTKPKKIVDCAKWVQAVVKAEELLLANHRWHAVTQILQARLVAVAVLLRKFPAAEQASILSRWERISFRIYGLKWADARTKVGDYTRLAWRIANENLSCSDIMRCLSDLGKDYAISDVIKEFDPSNCYEGWTEELRYLFYRYDEHLAAKAGQKLNEYQWNKIWAEEPAKSVEHIKPQSSGVSYLHHLGNLMMLPPGVNSSLKDKDPSLKAETYSSCGLLSSIEVAKLIEKGKWNKAAVEARAKRILAWSRSQWKD